MIRRINDFLHTWWPIMLSLAGASILVAMTILVNTAVDDRAALREQRDQLAVQSEHLAEIIERSERSESGAEKRLNQALVRVEEVLIDHFAKHDANVAQKLNDTLHRIEVLLGRPAGTPPEPVTAHPIAPPARHEPAPSSAPAPRSAPTTTAPRTSPRPATTTTTTPSQKQCAKRPNAPQC